MMLGVLDRAHIGPPLFDVGRLRFCRDVPAAPETSGGVCRRTSGAARLPRETARFTAAAGAKSVAWEYSSLHRVNDLFLCLLLFPPIRNPLKAALLRGNAGR